MPRVSDKRKARSEVSRQNVSKSDLTEGNVHVYHSVSEGFSGHTGDINIM